MPTKRLNITGRDVVLKNLQREVKGIKLRSAAGLVAAAAIVKKDAVMDAPVDTGNLRASGYMVVTGMAVDQPSPNFSNKHGDAALQAKNNAAALMEAQARVGVFANLGYLGEVGFTTTYAAPVHERHPTHGKFLENALKTNYAKILETIRRYARIKT